MAEAAAEFVKVLSSFARRDAQVIAVLERNRRAVETLFPEGPWKTLLNSMDHDIATSGHESAKSR
jgi:hypothetical protein